MAEPTSLGNAVEQLVPDRIRRLAVVPPGPYVGTETREDVAERAEKVRKYRSDAWERSLPARWRTATIATLTAEQDPQGHVSQWWGSKHLNLILWSPTPGVGKTHTAYAIGRQAAVEDGARVEAWTAADLLDGLRPGGDPPAVMARVVAADLLIVDDLGKEGSDKDFVRESWSRIFNARSEHLRRSVVTMNLTGAQLSERYDPSLVDRLVDDAVIVEARGRSRRKVAEWGS